MQRLPTSLKMGSMIEAQSASSSGTVQAIWGHSRRFHFSVAPMPHIGSSLWRWSSYTLEWSPAESDGPCCLGCRSLKDTYCHQQPGHPDRGLRPHQSLGPAVGNACRCLSSKNGSCLLSNAAVQTSWGSLYRPTNEGRERLNVSSAWGGGGGTAPMNESKQQGTHCCQVQPVVP